MTSRTDDQPGFDEDLAREVSRIRKDTIPIEVTKELLKHALFTVEGQAASLKGSELQINRLQRELVALHQIIEARDEELAKLREENKELHIDDLTGLWLRRMFKLLANQDLAQARRRAFLKDAEDGKVRVMSAVSVVMLDIDHFKRVNDTYGHDVGDLVLKGVTTWLKHAYRRDIDICGRWGGEEFVTYLPWCPVRSVVQRTLEMLQKLSLLRFGPEGGEKFPVTVSVGVSTLSGPDDTLETLIKRADEALYYGKQNGRDQVVVWTEGGFISLKTPEQLATTPL